MFGQRSSRHRTLPTQPRGAVILLGRTNMFRFNHPKEAAKLQRSAQHAESPMTDLSSPVKTCLRSCVLQPRAPDKGDGGEAEVREGGAERMQQEVESQRKESEQEERHRDQQEQKQRRRPQQLEKHLEEESEEGEVQETEAQEEEEEEDDEVQARREHAGADGALQGTERLKREREEQAVKIQLERRSSCGSGARRRRALLNRDAGSAPGGGAPTAAEIRGGLLLAKEARVDGEDAGEEALRSARERYESFKQEQVQELSLLLEGLSQQKERLEKEVANDPARRPRVLQHAHREKQRQEEAQLSQAEHRLQCKERQLLSLHQNHLPAVSEELHRAEEALERVRGREKGGSPELVEKELDEMLYQIEKELEEKQERLSQQSSQRAAPAAAADPRVHGQRGAAGGEGAGEEQEILETREKQQREARSRQWPGSRGDTALRRSISLEPEAEEARKRSVVASMGHNGTRNTAVPELDQKRMEMEIAQLKQRISESEASGRSLSVSSDEKTNVGNCPMSPIQSLNTVLPLTDDRLKAYIEEEVQKRLRQMNLQNTDNNNGLSLSSESLQNHHTHPVDPRRQKYERLAVRPSPSADSLKDPVKISIPRYVLRGQGKDEHYEFEVKITVLEETWTVFRRYSRFREMHKSLKMKYPELGVLEFPPKKIFGNRDERMVGERRNHLEVRRSA
ncbi:hypothetical protein AMELA_G00234120 [Ameiurus melas]|uniref:PX domain-containing protein n=1 Tax=Ameiurus melas TaxID=219545 RepID=A0A7J5ZXZ5_AMEME|nr:hypothetical protein AMELA_G00234120 [Ameiurus melas]